MKKIIISIMMLMLLASVVQAVIVYEYNDYYKIRNEWTTYNVKKPYTISFEKYEYQNRSYKIDPIADIIKQPPLTIKPPETSPSITKWLLQEIEQLKSKITELTKENTLLKEWYCKENTLDKRCTTTTQPK